MQPTYNDSFRHKGLRKQLVDGLRQKGITNQKVLDAINHVPRHFFLDSALELTAYEDRAFPIGEGQTISHPHTVAYQTELLQPAHFDKVLEIGTGSAYQSTILAQMGCRVFTIERQKQLYTRVQAHYPFKKEYPLIKFFFGDGFLGLPNYAPFDHVLVTAAAPFVPQQLLSQLKTGGHLVIPVGDGSSQQMKRYTKQADGTAKEELFEACMFVPMLQGKAS
ncbi:MAG: protein-L-isoaspartate(D-aspartate) O-methyltransferase [Bacteroidetes bacterium]|nr:MAG: protein-L-isoaspartate(D-aspartate) O-methyltransferase [Bacteroidota bacterium]